MATRKRTAAQRAIDLIEIEKLSLQGKTLREIATDLTGRRPYRLSWQQIGYDVDKLKLIWAEELKAELDTQKAKALAEVRVLQREYYEAWQHSQLNAEVEVLEQVGSRKAKKSKDGEEPEEPAIQPERLKKYKRTEGQSGNPAFLSGVQWCINKRCEILGLNAAAKHEVSGPHGEAIPISDEQHSRAISTLSEALGALLSGGGAGGEGTLGATE